MLAVRMGSDLTRGGPVLRRTATGGGCRQDQGAAVAPLCGLDTRINGGWPAYEEALKAAT